MTNKMQFIASTDIVVKPKLLMFLIYSCVIFYYIEFYKDIS